MKRKTLMVVAVLTAVSMLALLAFAGTTQDNGYELFKDFLKNSSAYDDVDSGAIEASMLVTDNGQVMVSIDGQIKANNEFENMSGQVTLALEDYTKTLEIYGLDQMIYLVDRDKGDAYMGQNHDEMAYKTSPRREHLHHEGDFDEKAEAIMDILIGDLKHEFKAVNDVDGTVNVQFELTKEEMPALLNMLTSGDFDHEDPETYEVHEDMDIEGYPLFDELKALELDHEELTDLSVEYISITLDLGSEKQLEGLEMSVKLSGVDSEGLNHEIEITGSMRVVAVGNVRVDTLDLEGLTLYELPE